MPGQEPFATSLTGRLASRSADCTGEFVDGWLMKLPLGSNPYHPQRARKPLTCKDAPEAHLQFVAGKEHRQRLGVLVSLPVATLDRAIRRRGGVAVGRPWKMIIAVVNTIS